MQGSLVDEEIDDVDIIHNRYTFNTNEKPLGKGAYGMVVKGWDTERYKSVRCYCCLWYMLCIAVVPITT